MPPVLMTVSAPVTSVMGLLESAYSENPEVVTHCETDSPGQGWGGECGSVGREGVAGGVAGEGGGHLASLPFVHILFPPVLGVTLVEVKERELHPAEGDRQASVTPHKLELERNVMNRSCIGHGSGRVRSIFRQCAEFSIGRVHVDIAEVPLDSIELVPISTFVTVFLISKFSAQRLHDAHAGGQRHAVRASEAVARAGEARAPRTQLG